VTEDRESERARIRREITESGLRRIEVDGRVQQAWRAKPRITIDLAAPPNVRHSVTGRHELQPPADLRQFGRYFSLARRRAGMSQQRLADRSGVSQSMVSRFERGLAPAMGVRYLVALSNVLGQLFPLGVCPHDHDCGWQPVKPPQAQVSFVERWLERLQTETPPTPTATEMDQEVEDEPLISVTLADLSVGSEHGDTD
jgi:transcriptional regulator with XRE-family HTH domain